MDGLVYIPGNESKITRPLARYLPSVPEGVAATFSTQHIPRGTLVLDPFGAEPQSPLEMARLGFNVLVAVNNPIDHFLIEMAANPPSQADLRAALSELAASYKGSERLETHLQSIYLTECNRCRQKVPAEAFVWDNAGGTLVERIYRCPCGDSGIYPATETDRANAARFAATGGLHRARALERVAAPQDPDRRHAEEALECYLPRAVYTLITIINKLDGLSLTPGRRCALLALVLTACDEANALWPYPPERPRPKQLTIPARFLEKNIWLALERSIDIWSGREPSVQVVDWRKSDEIKSGWKSQGEEGRLFLFDGPVRDLVPHLKDIPLGAIVTVIPRPNQAFWTLSALWTGWLWGQEAAAPFKSVLRRRRYDWNWHAVALHGAFNRLFNQLPLNAPMFALIPELEPALLTATLMAAAGAGFDLTGLALRTRHDPAQVIWHRRAFSHSPGKRPEINSGEVCQAMQDSLKKRGEPAFYLFLHSAGLISMAAVNSLAWRQDALAQIHAPILAALTKPEFIHQSESRNPEIGLWSLNEWDLGSDPLSDRVEIATVHFLQNNPGSLLRDVELAVNMEFPGLLTPSQGLMRALLESYAVDSEGRWSLRPEDEPTARRMDLEQAVLSLGILATRLGYTLENKDKKRRLILWQEQGATACAFYILASAVAGNLLRKNAFPPEKSVLVLPGGRAGLLAYKLNRDPNLRALAEHWKIIKFRTLRRLVEMTDITRKRFEEELSYDPIEPPEQMRLF